VLDVYYIPDELAADRLNSSQLPYSHPRPFRQYTFQAARNTNYYKKIPVLLYFLVTMQTIVYPEALPMLVKRKKKGLL
jgi:hypothetical protein